MILNLVKAGKGAYGYNAATGEFGDMLEEGILDPTKVTRLALQNAASVAGLLLTTEVMVAEAPKKNEAPGMPGRGLFAPDRVRLSLRSVSRSGTRLPTRFRSAPEAAKSSNALSVTRMICRAMNGAPSATATSGCLRQSSHS